MIQAHSRLDRLLRQRKLTVPELHRKIAASGVRINVKSLYRLRNEAQPLKRLDLDVAGAICSVCEVPLTELVSFEPLEVQLRRFPSAQQRRLDTLMAKNNDGTLTKSENSELQDLVHRAEEVMLANARVLARHRQTGGKPATRAGRQVLQSLRDNPRKVRTKR